MSGGSMGFVGFSLPSNLWSRRQGQSSLGRAACRDRVSDSSLKVSRAAVESTLFCGSLPRQLSLSDFKLHLNSGSSNHVISLKAAPRTVKGSLSSLKRPPAWKPKSQKTLNISVSIQDHKFWVMALTVQHSRVKRAAVSLVLSTKQLWVKTWNREMGQEQR